MLFATDIAHMIDHSLLKPQLTDQDIRDGCSLAREYDCASVCARPTDLPLVREELAGSGVLLSTVIGFPHGSSRTDVKVFEAERALADGAVELDMVLNIGKLLSGDYRFVEEDIRAVVRPVHAAGGIVKVIFENCCLSDSLKIEACRIACAAGCDFVKTSTGYGTGGATIADLVLMRANCPPSVRVKAAGGVRTLDDALAVRKAGAVRFGATATKIILDDARLREQNGTLQDLADGIAARLGPNY